MVRSRDWLVSRIAWLCAAGVVTAAPWCAAERLAPAPRLLEPPTGLHLVTDAPSLLAVPNDCACVGLDFVPPVPQVGPVRPGQAARPLPVENRPQGLSENATGFAAQPRPLPAPQQRLPAIETERPAARVAQRLPATDMLIDRLEPASKSHPDMRSAPAPRSNLRPVERTPGQRAVERAVEVSPPQRPAMQAVSERASSIVARGVQLADRGASYSARAEFIQALRIVTQALDAQAGETAHSQALADGLRALEEADDFAPHGSQLEADLDLGSIIASHRTPVLKQASIAGVTPLSALQQYYTFAQQRLSTAGGREPAASQALFGLGRLTTLMAERSPDDRRLHGPKAMTLYQAALAVDGRNHRAAHELGVQYAQFGQLEDAKRLLVISANLAPRKETWHNLAVVHERLGEADLARKARYELQLASRPAQGPVTTANGVAVQWVDPGKFKDGPMGGPAVRNAARPSGPSNPWLK